MTFNNTQLRLKPLALACLHMVLALPLYASITAQAHANDAKSIVLNSTASTSATIDVGMDKSILPGEDFNRYVNGHWEKTATIPDDKMSVGVFDSLIEDTDIKVAKLIEATTKAAPGTAARKIGDFYQAYLNMEHINQLGLSPLQSQLDHIAALTDKTALATYLGQHLRADVDPINATHVHTENLFGLWVSQGFHDHTTYTAYLLQGGLGLSDREYYVSKNPKMVELRSKYLAHIAAILKLANTPDPDNAAKRIFALETRIAQSHATREATSDVLKANNTWSQADFAKKARGLDWSAYFSAAGLQAQSSFIIWHPGALKGSAALVANTPLDIWKEYLRFHAINQRTGVLPQAFADQQFALRSAFTGAKKPLPRWRDAVDVTNYALGEEVGKLYVEQNFSAEAKQRIRSMVTNLLDAFSARVSALTWMSPKTKAEALEKIKHTYVGVGYPDKWRDYSGLQVSTADAFGNTERASAFFYQEALAKLGKPVDVTEWCMNPQLVNAVNMPLQNAINFPAAFLQSPNFDLQASDAANYGAIGATIGHEISHSFDNSGAMFDSKGELRNWWSKSDLAHFNQSSKALVAQFSAYKPFPDLAVNGQQTLGENIADLAGLMAAFDAYRSAMKQKGQVVTKETDQEFFLSFARTYRGKMRDETLRSIIVTNEHAPEQFRLLTVRNLDAWYPAFNVQPGQKQYLTPKDRVRVW